MLQHTEVIQKIVYMYIIKEMAFRYCYVALPNISGFQIFKRFCFNICTFAERVHAQFIHSLFLVLEPIFNNSKSQCSAQFQFLLHIVPMQNLVLPKTHIIYLIKVIPEFCIAHCYCERFLCHECVHVQNIRDFPQTKLDSEKKAPFLLNEHGDPHFLFYKFNENNIRNN